MKLNNTAALVFVFLATLIVSSSPARAQYITQCTSSNCWNVYGTVYYTVPTLSGVTDAVVVTQNGNEGQIRIECPNASTTGCADLVPGEWVVIKGGIYGAFGTCVDGPNNQVQGVDFWRWDATEGKWFFYDKTAQEWDIWE